MSKFFTPAFASLLALVGSVLGSDSMIPNSKAPESEAPAEEAWGGSGLPARLEAGRFAALGKKSPFTLASATEENADFAKDLFLAGYFRTEGKDFVLVSSRSSLPNTFTVGSQISPASRGMVLLKVVRDPSGDPSKMKALIRQGTETATLQYGSPTPSASQPSPFSAAPAIQTPLVPPAVSIPNPPENPAVRPPRVTPITPPPGTPPGQPSR